MGRFSELAAGAGIRRMPLIGAEPRRTARAAAISARDGRIVKACKTMSCLRRSCPKLGNSSFNRLVTIQLGCLGSTLELRILRLSGM
jgi:hypothetical protein